MFSFDFFMLIISCLQPLIIGFLSFISIGRCSSWINVFWSLSSKRSRISNFKVYESATQSRLNNFLKFNFSFFSIIITFLIYDIDLLFFIPELLMISSFGIFEFLFLLFLVLCLIFGLWLDEQYSSFSWEIL